MVYRPKINVQDYGKVVVCLDEALKKRSLSMTKLAHLANTHYKNIKRLCGTDDIRKVDLDILARICYVMECETSEIIRYVPSGNVEPVE